MFTKPQTVVDLKTLFLEGLINHTTKVTKISDDSVLSGVGYGIAKVAQKAMKDIALIESHLFVESAYGDHLDLIADRLGISPRFTAAGSSTYLRLVADPGTFYQRTIHSFTGAHGIEFELENDVTIGVHGFNYVKVRSTTTGKKTNVDPVSVNQVTPIPTGHQYVINEVMPYNGRDAESDDLFRKRIKETPNLCARSTISYIEQVLMKLQPDVLRVIYAGVDDNGKDTLMVVTQSGIDLTVVELNTLAASSADFLAVSELKPWGYTVYGVKYINPTWDYVDVDMRVDIDNTANPDDIRRDIQIGFLKYLDFRYWDYSKKVEWDDLLQIAKSTKGVKYVPDQMFNPQVDKIIPTNKLPRMRSFILRNLAGTIISNVSGTIQPIFYPNSQDESYRTTVLYSI